MYMHSTGLWRSSLRFLPRLTRRAARKTLDASLTNRLRDCTARARTHTRTRADTHTLSLIAPACPQDFLDAFKEAA